MAHRRGGAHPRLAAAVAAAGGDGTCPHAGRARGVELLPAAMVPSGRGGPGPLPLTANGKTDRAAVPGWSPEPPGGGGTGDAPGPVEREVARIWADLLGCDRVGRDDNFFALGGDSLLATRVVAALRAAGTPTRGSPGCSPNPCCGTSPRPSPRGAGPGARPALSAPTPHTGTTLPAHRGAARLLLGPIAEFTLGGVGTYHYSEFDGGPKWTWTGCERAWNRLVRRHEMLRAVFDDHGDQRVLAEVPAYRIAVVDAADTDPHRLADAARADVAPPVRPDPVAAVRGARRAVHADGGTRLGIGLDYIVLDALSIMTLYTELDRLHTDPDAELPPVEVSFRDYVPGPGRPRGGGGGGGVLAGTDRPRPPAPDLPLAVDPATSTAPGSSVAAHRLARREWRALAGLARSAGITPSDRCWPATPTCSPRGAGRRS